MDFRIGDTSTDSLTRLSCEEQKAVKTTPFDAIGLRLYKSHVGQATLVSRKVLLELVKETAVTVTLGHFLVST